MTLFQDLSQYEQDCINAGRAERGSPPLMTPQAAFLRPVTALAGVPAPGSESVAFNDGVEVERQRSLFADRVRLAVARRLENTSRRSRDAVAVALLSSQQPRIVVEPAVARPQAKALTPQEQTFADALCRKIARARGYAQLATNESKVPAQLEQEGLKMKPPGAGFHDCIDTVCNAPIADSKQMRFWRARLF
jgi:hypothetical protein